MSIFSCVDYAQNIRENPALWYSNIKAEEDRVSSEIHDLQVAWLRTPNAKTRKDIHARLRSLNAELDIIDNEIKSMRAEKFVEHPSAEWLNVIQKAYALNEFNKEKAADLESWMKPH